MDALERSTTALPIVSTTASAIAAIESAVTTMDEGAAAWKQAPTAAPTVVAHDPRTACQTRPLTRRLKRTVTRTWAHA